MWPRVVELMLGVWLVISPFVFRGTPELDRYVANDIACGTLVIVASLFCFWHPARRAHLVTLAISVWLAGYGYFSAPRPGPPAAQNEIIVGLLLLLFAILPSEATRPPESWRKA